MPFRCGSQIGVEAQGLDQVVSREFGRDRGVVEGRGVDAAEEACDARRHRWIGSAGQHFGLPEDVVVGRQVVEDDDAGLRVGSDDVGCAARHDPRRAFQPGDFVMIALDRGFPVHRDF
jgi:hypothetical protein